MDYSRLFAADAHENELVSYFIEDLDKSEFTKALDSALGQIWAGSERSTAAVGRIFSIGVAQFTHYIALSERDENKNEDFLENVPEPAISGDVDGLIQPLEEIKEVSSAAIADFDDEDGEDITELAKPQTRSSSLSESFEAVNLSGNSSPDGKSSSVSRVEDAYVSSDITHLDNSGDNDDAETLSHDEITTITIVGQIAEFLTVWCVTVTKHATVAKRDVLAHVFGPPGSGKSPNESHMHALLTKGKIYIERAIELNDLERAGSLRKLIILIHEILHALFVALSLEAGTSNSNDTVIVKSLLFGFFQVDFSETLQSLLDRTTGKQYPLINPVDSEKKPGSDSEKPKLRLSYETVMKIYGIYVSLANCPIEAILVDKMSLSLDITTPQDTSPNTYRRFLESLDFGNPETFSSWNTRFVAQLAAIYNYYYEMSPDILRHSLRHSSFFGWITGNTLSSGQYLSVDTMADITSFAEVTLDPNDPFLYEVDQFEHKRRLKQTKGKGDFESAVRSASYLAITFQLLELLNNKSFAEAFTTQSNTKVPLLDVWLCVSSYVHHYQFRSTVNSFGSRVSLLLLLKLTSQKSLFDQTLHDYKIDENTWKLCHHTHPVIPLDENCPKKDLSLYLIDIIQVTLRFNLSKRLDPENAKIALTVLYQILLQLEEHPTEGIRTYAWNELYSALLKFLVFISRNQNEEGVKYVVEEIFSIIQLLLSPVFDKVVEKTSDFFSIGYHPAKSMNFDLLYLMLQQHNTLEALFNTYIKRKDNFGRVKTALAHFKTKLASASTPELHADDVAKMINELAAIKKDTSPLTTIKMDKFNYAETFKYLGRVRDYEEFPKQKELLRAFISIFETDWVGTH